MGGQSSFEQHLAAVQREAVVGRDDIHTLLTVLSRIDVDDLSEAELDALDRLAKAIGIRMHVNAVRWNVQFSVVSVDDDFDFNAVS